MTIPKRLLCFAHGMESGPWGTKISHLAPTARARGFEILSPDYSHSRDPHQRLAQLLELAPAASEHLVMVGSSLGGYVSAMACAALKPKALMLLAPALYFPGFDEEPSGIPRLAAVVHGWNDDIVPVDASIRFARQNRAALHILDSGHTLNDRLPDLTAIFGALLDHLPDVAA